MSSVLQVSEPINIPTYTQKEYMLDDNLFDPFQKSPPNVFINHLKSRISRLENEHQKIQTNVIKICVKKTDVIQSKN